MHGVPHPSAAPLEACAGGKRSSPAATPVTLPPLATAALALSALLLAVIVALLGVHVSHSSRRAQWWAKKHDSGEQPFGTHALESSVLHHALKRMAFHVFNSIFFTTQCSLLRVVSARRCQFQQH